MVVIQDVYYVLRRRTRTCRPCLPEPTPRAPRSPPGWWASCRRSPLLPTSSSCGDGWCKHGFSPPQRRLYWPAHNFLYKLCSRRMSPHQKAFVDKRAPGCPRFINAVRRRECHHPSQTLIYQTLKITRHTTTPTLMYSTVSVVHGFRVGCVCLYRVGW